MKNQEYGGAKGHGRKKGQKKKKRERLGTLRPPRNDKRKKEKFEEEKLSEKLENINAVKKNSQESTKDRPGTLKNKNCRPKLRGKKKKLIKGVERDHIQEGKGKIEAQHHAKGKVYQEGKKKKKKTTKEEQ